MWPWSENRRIYMDYASAPPVSERALLAMREAEGFTGNPGALHEEGRRAKEALYASRESVAKELQCKPREIIFTSGLTEANNLAIVGAAKALLNTRRSLEGTQWIVSAIEHSCVLKSFQEVEMLGCEVVYVQPDKHGIITPDAVGELLTHETVFVSIGWGNNEIGTIQPLSKIRAVLDMHERENGTQILLHTDAGQAPLYEYPRVHTLGVDLFALGSNKMYGPHGIGALYVSNRAALSPLIVGGGQERSLRAGTENVSLAAGFATALKEVGELREKESKRVRLLRDAFFRLIQKNIPEAVINGDVRRLLPHMLNISIPEIQPEYIALALDTKGIAMSTKSACREGEESESHAVRALNLEPFRAKGALRFSLGRDTTDSDITRTAEALLFCIQASRGRMQSVQNRLLL